MGWEDEKGDVAEGMKAVYKSTLQGCATTLWAATSDSLEGLGGLYCEDCDIADMAGEKPSAFAYVAPHATCEDSAERLWKLTETLLDEAKGG